MMLNLVQFLMSLQLLTAAPTTPQSYAVTIPPGVTYRRLGTADSELGEFVFLDSGQRIRADIGLMAGLYLTDPKEKDTKSLQLIIKISGNQFPKVVQISISKDQLRYVGHMDSVVNNDQELSRLIILANSIRFDKK